MQFFMPDTGSENDEGRFWSSNYKVVGTTVGSPAHPHHARPSTKHQPKIIDRI